MAYALLIKAEVRPGGTGICMQTKDSCVPKMPHHTYKYIPELDATSVPQISIQKTLFSETKWNRPDKAISFPSLSTNHAAGAVA